MYLYTPAIRSVHKHMPDIFRKILIRGIKIKTILLSKCIKDTSGIACLVCNRLPSVYDKCSIRDTQRRIRYHKFLGKLHLITDTVAYLTRTKRIVKRECPRLYLINAHTTVSTWKTLAESNLFFARNIYYKKPVRKSHNIFNRIGKSLFYSLSYNKPVNHYLYIMLFIFL